MATEERLLLERARRGDPRAMDRLLARNKKQVYRFGLQLCGEEDAAKEVLQQTLFTAFRSLHDFRGDARLSTWLYQIARSYCSKAHRRRVDEPAVLDALDSPDALEVRAGGPSPEEAAQAREVGAALEKAIRSLPPRHREVLILRDLEGLTAEEAAGELGIEVTNLKTRLHRARKELRQQLAALAA